MTSSRIKITYALILFVGIIGISFSAIFVRWSEAPSAVMAMNRLYLTNLLMLPFLYAYRREFLSLTWRDWSRLFWSGLALGLHFLFWMESLRFTSVASSTAILTLEPVLVMLGSYFVFKERKNSLAVAGILLAIVGAIAIGWGDFGISTRALAGDALSFVGALAVAVHMLLGKDLRNRISAYTYSFSVFFFAASVMCVYSVAMGYTLFDYPAREWGVFLLLAIVPTVFGHLLFNWLLKYISATSVSMSVLGEPVGATILAYMLLGESVHTFQVAACILLLFGVWLFIRFSSRPGRNSTPWKRNKKTEVMTREQATS